MAVIKGTDITGTTNPDIILVDGAGTASGFNGSDLIVGDTSSFQYLTGGNSQPFAQSIDSQSAWSITQNEMFGDYTTPHTSVVLEPVAGMTNMWFSVTVGAGQILTIDIDYGYGSIGSTHSTQTRLDLYDQNGNLVAISDQSASTNGGVGSSGSDPYISYIAAHPGIYFIKVWQFGGVFTGAEQELLNISVTGHAYADPTDSADLLDGGAGDDHIFGIGGDDTIYGGDGNDSLFGDEGNDTISAGIGYNTISGGLGTDTVVYDTVDVAVDLDIGAAQSKSGTTVVDTLSGIENVIGSNGATGDLINGSGAANVIDGRDGNDTISSWGGNDTLLGGAGNDNIDAGEGDDWLEGEGGNDVLQGGTGNDTASYGSDDGVTVSLALQGSAQDTGSSGFDTLVGIENLSGSAFNDALTGDALANVLWGLDGNDTIFGGAGNDAVHGGAGDDLLDGGDGRDLLSYADALGPVTVSLQRPTAQATGSAGRDTIANFEDLDGSSYADNLTGSMGDNLIRGLEGHDTISGLAGVDTLEGGGGNDILYGGNDNDLLYGGAGNDTLVGGAGDDYMAGGLGDDAYSVNSLLDQVIEAAGAGTDTIRAAGISLTLGANVENLTIVSGAVDGTGNGLGNTIVGSGASNALSGLAGNDILRGLTGHDTLDGGTGNDLLTGGAGRDTLTGGEGADRFIFAALSDCSAGTAFADTITDFSRAQGDKIGLLGIDAITGGTDDAFHLIGSDAFTRTAGELRYQFDNNGNTVVQMDVNGDGIADMSIILTGQIDLVASDFIL